MTLDGTTIYSLALLAATVLWLVLDRPDSKRLL